MRFVAGWGAKAKSHREDAAGQGRRSGRDTAGRGTVAERLQRGGAVAELLAGALRRSCWLGRRGKDADAREIPSGRGKNSMREGKAASEKNMHLSFQMNKI